MPMLSIKSVIDMMSTTTSLKWDASQFSWLPPLFQIILPVIFPLYTRWQRDFFCSKTYQYVSFRGFVLARPCWPFLIETGCHFWKLCFQKGIKSFRHLVILALVIVGHFGTWSFRHLVIPALDLSHFGTYVGYFETLQIFLLQVKFVAIAN